jgi:transposase InsO family protein
MEHVALGMKVKDALEICDISRHQYYYKPKGTKQGPAPSEVTHKKNVDIIEEIDNKKVVKIIEENHSDPDLSYGYQKMTKELQLSGYYINKKKVYRLMGENQLLRPRIKTSGTTYVKYRKVCPLDLYEVIEMDIKFKWIESKISYAYILTILNVFSRKVLNWHAGMSITQHTVKDLWEKVIVGCLQPYDALSKGVRIEIRNDNDKRFSAKSVQSFFEENYINQVFTHPYTPQENGHIESFNSILGRSIDEYNFYTLEELERHLILFYEKYNNIRLHSCIANLSPAIFIEQWKKGNIWQCVDLQKKWAKFKLNISYQEVFNTSGNANWREASCLDWEPLNGATNPGKVNGAITIFDTSVQRSPSVVSC